MVFVMDTLLEIIIEVADIFVDIWTYIREKKISGKKKEKKESGSACE